MIKTKNGLIAGVLLVATFSLCKVATESGDQSTRTVKALRIAATEISPWTEDANGFREFSNLGELTTIMNGGADEYYNRNAIDGFFQFMSNKKSESSTYSIECRVLDFGTAANATTMFTYKIEDVSTKQAAGTIPVSDAVIDPDASLSGCKGYAHFGQYFFELSFTGYGSNKTESINNAASFIEVFKAKVSQM